MRADLVEQHVHLPGIVARQMIRAFPSHVDLDELIADGNVGLVHAARDFEPGRGVKFNTFATRRIRGEILDGFRRRNHVRRVAHADLVPLDDSQLLEAPGPTVEERAELREQLAQVVALPDRERAALVAEDARAVLHVNESRVNQLRRRARTRLGCQRPGTSTLSDAEFAALEAAAHGFTARQTAERLVKSEETVKSQRRAVIAKLGARDITNAVYLAVSRGLLRPAA